MTLHSLLAGTLAPALALALTGVACEPELPLDDGLVTAPRVLAVRGEPAESKPGTPVVYTALVATPDASTGDAAISWDFCVAPKSPSENNVVSPECLGPSASVPLGSGSSISAPTPRDACSRFGPDTPPGDFRPRDPDVTGGYYQPLRLELAGAAPAFHLQRLLCGLGAASAELASEFAASYVPNSNPRLLPLTAAIAGSELTLDAMPAIPRRARVTFVASWPAEDSETFAVFDRAAQAITTRRESMRVAWYVTAGQLALSSTGRGESDPASSVSNSWEAPDVAGPVTLWVVLRDARGGVDFARYELTVANAAAL